MNKLLLFAVFCLVVGPGWVLAQTSVPVDTMPHIYTLNAGDDWNPGQPESVDSTLGNFHRYFPSYYLGRSHLGSAGLRGWSLTDQVPTKYLDYGFGPYAWYDHQDESVRYFHVIKPFTRAFYVAGPGNEQFLDVEHAQRIRPNWFAGLNFKVGGADGNLSRQKSGYTHLQLTSEYRSKDQRYGIHGNFLMNRLNSEENGGLVSDSLFQVADNINRLGGAVNLTNASNRLRTMGINIHQRYDFGGVVPVRPDTTGMDSLSADSVMRIVLPDYKPVFRVFHHGHVKQAVQRFVDSSPDSAFYEPLFTYVDSVGILDSLNLTRVENTVGLQLLPDDSGSFFRRLTYSVSLTHQNVNLYQNSHGRIYDNLIAGGSILGGTSEHGRWSAYGDHVVLGWNSGDFTLGGWWTRPVPNVLSKLRVAASAKSRKPAIVYQLYHTDYFAWDSILNATTTLEATVELENKKYQASLGLHFETHDRYTYFDENSLPAQASQASLFRLNAAKQFKFRNWHLDGQLWYQVTGGADVIRVPQLLGLGSAYWEGLLFKRAMRARVGADVTWHSAYSANAFEPAIGQFRLQNEVEVGKYPYVDLYVAFKVKKAKIFVKAFHINQGLTDHTYFELPGYPSQGRAIKFGIDWIFFN